MKIGILFTSLVFVSTQALAETYECNGFEPGFHMTINKQEVILEEDNAKPAEHLSPVSVSQGNKTGLRAYRVM